MSDTTSVARALALSQSVLTLTARPGPVSRTYLDALSGQDAAANGQDAPPPTRAGRQATGGVPYSAR